ncbi:MAG: hypothetical protein K2P64_12370 [Lachnospiraceae bacterium]|nr:hypothetical protein [Lachnospiraceae bacterium]
MSKPYIKKLSPFDAEKDYELTISWFGNRAIANRILIYDNQTNELVFDNTISTYMLKHKIPANTLVNGKKYVIQAQIYDIRNKPSSLSDKVLFYTFKTPDFYFENIPEDSIIENSSFEASVHYYSSDYEDISKYVFYLYDGSKKKLLNSGEIADGDHIIYNYRGLENHTVYYLRCMGVTVNGMDLDTGYVEVSVKFENPNQYARIYAAPIPSQGCIQITSNLIIIQYNGTDIFEYADGMIDLHDKTLYYDKGFLIKDDFTILIRGTNLWQDAEIFRISNGNSYLTLSSRIYNDGRLRFKLLVPNGAAHYLLYSDPQVFEREDMITLAIRKKNNVYQLNVSTGLKSCDTENNIQLGGE